MAKKVMDSGFSNWTPERLGSLESKNYFITGGNSGIGLEAAVMLKDKGANVIIGCRSPERGSEALKVIESRASTGSVSQVTIDLADTASIRAAATELADRVDGLDAVVNNAGVMQTPERKTADGFELQLGTNHLGHFLLNSLTFGLVEARKGRIVAVSSIAARAAKRFSFDNPMFEGNYSATNVYGQSKLANLMFAMELHRRLTAAGSDVVAIAVHPGYSATNLQSSGPTGFWKPLYKLSNALMAQPAAKGGIPLVLAAAGDEARAGGYYGPTGIGEMRGGVGDAVVNDHALNADDGAALWEWSEEVLGIDWKVG